MPPVVSIIIPCYNQGRYLAETLDSVIHQTFTLWEAIIVNDGSTDNSEQIALSYAEQDKRFQYICQENSGVSVARNNAARYAKGKYLLPLDGDDKIGADYLAKAVEYLERHPECKVFYCKGEKFDGETGPVEAYYTDYKSMLLYNSLFNSMVFRTLDFEKIGGYDEEFREGWEDWDFSIRLLADGGEVFQSPDVMFFYRFHNQVQESRTVEADKIADKLMDAIYVKHHHIYNRYFPNGLKAIRILEDYYPSKKALAYYEAEYCKLKEQVYMCGITCKNAHFNKKSENKSMTIISNMMNFSKSMYLIYLLCFSELSKYRGQIHERIRWSQVKLVWESELFDADYYKAISKVKLTGIALAVHYLYIGWKDGLEPSEMFSGNAYLACYQDIAETHQCPLLHYEKYGKYEGRMFLSKREYENCSITQKDYQYVEQLKQQHKKVVLLVSHELSLTGAPRALLNLAVRFRKLGVESIIWSLQPGDLDKELAEHNFSYKVVTLLFASSDGKHFFTDEVKDYISMFDMVLINTIVALPKIEFFRNINIKKVCWIHDGSYGFSCCPITPKFAEYYKLYDRIFVVGDYARRIAMLYGEKGTQMQNLIYGIDDIANKVADDDVIANDATGNYFTMILAGTIEERKGQDILLKALSMLSSQVLEVLRIKIVGKIINKDLAQQLSADRTGCVEMVGPVSHDMLIKMMMCMDILLCPSIDDPMPIVCTEAFMLSKPIIVSDNTGTASFIIEGENGFVVRSGDAKALADAITQAIESRSKLVQMGKKARAVFEQNFTNEIFEKNLREQLLSMLS